MGTQKRAMSSKSGNDAHAKGGTNDGGGTEPRGIMTPYRFLQDAIRAVPAVRYALGVAGVVSVVAIVAAMGIDFRLAAWGALVTLVLMVGLVVFAKLTTTAREHFVLPALVLMWSFLVVLIASVVLMLLSVFFKIPVDLQNWIKPGQTGTATTGRTVQNGSAREDDSAAVGIAKAAAAEAEAHQGETAWRMFEDARREAPSSELVRRSRIEFAKGWLHLRYGDIHTTEVADAVLPALYEAEASASGKEKADLLAHIGLARLYLALHRDGMKSYDLGPVQQALALDGSNIYAHGVLAVVAASRDGRFARDEFAAAFAPHQDDAFVRDLRQQTIFGILQGETQLRAICETARAIRVNKESLDAWQKYRFVETYLWRVDEIADLSGDAVTPAEHLKTLAWLAELGLTEDRDDRARWELQRRYATARLTETAGDKGAALALYHALAGDVPAQDADLNKKIGEGIRRCGGRPTTDHR